MEIRFDYLPIQFEDSLDSSRFRVRDIRANVASAGLINASRLTFMRPRHDRMRLIHTWRGTRTRRTPYAMVVAHKRIAWHGGGGRGNSDRRKTDRLALGVNVLFLFPPFFLFAAGRLSALSSKVIINAYACACTCACTLIYRRHLKKPLKLKIPAGRFSPPRARACPFHLETTFAFNKMDASQASRDK